MNQIQTQQIDISLMDLEQTNSKLQNNKNNNKFSDTLVKSE